MNDRRQPRDEHAPPTPDGGDGLRNPAIPVSQSADCVAASPRSAPRPDARRPRLNRGDECDLPADMPAAA